MLGLFIFDFFRPPHITFCPLPRLSRKMVAMKLNDRSGEYREFLAEIRQKIRDAQYKALKAVNKELINLYWDIGKMIVERQKKVGWGKSVVEKLSADL